MIGVAVEKGHAKMLKKINERGGFSRNQFEFVFLFVGCKHYRNLQKFVLVQAFQEIGKFV